MTAIAARNNVPMPLEGRLVKPRRSEFKAGQDPLEGRMSQPFVDYFSNQGKVLEQAPVRLTTVVLTGQAASIGATDMSGGSLSAGLYQLQYYTRITQAATTSSSLTITFDWLDGGVTPTYSGAAITGNTVTTTQTGTLLIRIGANAAVRYSTTYASVGATPMQYRLDIVLSEVNA